MAESPRRRRGRRGSIVNRQRQLKKERENVQKKTFCRWVNLQLTRKGKVPISNLDSGFHTGVSLCDLVEVLCAKRLRSKWSRNPKNSIQMLENLSISLDHLKKKCKIRLVGIGNRSLFDGDVTLTLGLVWTLILHFQIESIEVDASGEVEAASPTKEKLTETKEAGKEEPVKKEEKKKKKVSGKKALLLWAQAHTKAELERVARPKVKNLHTSWRDGHSFNALISHFRPDLVDMEKVKAMASDEERLKHAFDVGSEDLGLPALLDADDMLEGPRPDEKAVTTYLVELFRLFQNATPVAKPEPPKPPSPEPVKEKERTIVQKVRRVPAARPPSEMVRKEARRITRYEIFENSTIGTALIVDMGTSTLRVGISGDEAPRAEDPVVVGRHYLPKIPEPGLDALGLGFALIDEEEDGDFVDDGPGEEGRDYEDDGEDEDYHEDDVLVGSAAVLTSTRGILKLESCMSRGIVTNWVDMERMWQSTYERVNADTEKHDAIVIEAPLNPVRHMERVATLHFESFGSPSIMRAPPASYLALLRAGRTSGIGFDSGSDVTHVATVVEGVIISTSVKRIEWGGSDVTRAIVRKLKHEGRMTNGDPVSMFAETLQHHFAVDAIKTRRAFVQQRRRQGDDSARNLDAGDVDCTLPDGSSIRVDGNVFDLSSYFFDSPSPTLELPSAQTMIANAAKTVDNPTTRRLLLRSITVSGGNTLTKNFSERLEDELRVALPKESIVVTSPASRIVSAFGGASILYELRSLRHQFVTRKEYDEYGAAAALARKRAFFA
eukprot:g537.t1